MFRVSLFSLFMLFVPLSLLASENGELNEKAGDEIYIDLRFGISPYLGVIGMEAQKGNYALGIGMPGNLSFTYYDKPHSDSKFFSVGIGRVSDNEYNDKQDGVFYDELESRFFSVGAGYRWQWPSGWNVTASLSAYFANDEYTNSYQVLEEDVILLFPGVMGGFAF